MTEASLEFIAVPIISAIVGGIGWLVKRYFDERDKDKAEMKADIEGLKEESKTAKKRIGRMEAMIFGCPHEDCPNKKLLIKEKGIDYGNINNTQLD